jgi:hypothetical protein
MQREMVDWHGATPETLAGVSRLFSDDAQG